MYHKHPAKKQSTTQNPLFNVLFTKNNENVEKSTHFFRGIIILSVQNRSYTGIYLGNMFLAMFYMDHRQYSVFAIVLNF